MAIIYSTTLEVGEEEEDDKEKETGKGRRLLVHLMCWQNRYFTSGGFTRKQTVVVVISSNKIPQNTVFFTQINETKVGGIRDI